MTETETIRQELAGLLSGVGLALVDLVISRHRGSVQVRATVYSAEGTGIHECSKAHRLIQPRLQVLLDVQDFHLEVASPGTDRILRDASEYAVFVGRGAKVMLAGESEWIGCRIAASDGVNATLEVDGQNRTVPIADIVKARLDYAQEGS